MKAERQELVDELETTHARYQNAVHMLDVYDFEHSTGNYSKVEVSL